MASESTTRKRTWLTRSIPVLLLSSLCCCSADVIHCKENEREALLQFRRGLEDPGAILSSWAGEDCCHWVGIGCDNRTGRVIRLDLGYKNTSDFEGEWALRGEISPSLVQMKYLQYLDLFGNNFQGMQFPKFIGSFERLTYLDLIDTNLSGYIPDQLGNLSSLQHLYLDCLGYSGSSLESNGEWLARLSSLRVLYIIGVNLKKATGLFPALNMLPVLSNISLSDCGIRSIPPSLSHVNFTRLSRLSLSGNDFHSPVPNWLFNITSLEYLYLWGNNFMGVTPSAPGGRRKSQLKTLYISDIRELEMDVHELTRDLCNLEDMTFAGTRITGNWEEAFSGCSRNSVRSLSLMRTEIAGQFPNFNRNLQNIEQLKITENELNGTIPSSLGKLTSLTDLDLSSNKLKGSIPEWVGDMSLLQTLGLFDNELNGTIPSSLGKLTSLTSLYLSINKLKGSIPERIGDMSSLQILQLSGNELNGTIPSSLGKLTSLTELDLSGNKLKGSIPQNLWRVLQHLLLSDNFLDGVVSQEHLSNLTQLRSLDLSSNHLELEVAPNWDPPFHLEWLDLGSCSVGPHFPLWLQTQSTLQTLNLSSSKISDTLPWWIWNFSSGIGNIDLSDNMITGTVQNAMNASNLEELDLSSNMFVGPLPQFHGSTLSVLILSNNSFSGPAVLGNLTGLDMLSLSMNDLSGEFPASLCEATSLSLLDISSNHLSGNIPDCTRAQEGDMINSFPKLKSIHLSNNEFSGAFPTFFKGSRNMSVLDISENRFTGNIPAWIGDNLRELKILSLRSNMFHGSIPSSFSNLKSLQVLDLSHNNLSGRIPRFFGKFEGMKVTHLLNESIGYGTFYKEKIVMAIDEQDMKYDTTLALVTSMDLSRNRFSGGIPRDLGALVSLRILNLSDNCLTGKILETLSQLRWLEFLDLSRNELVGGIPQSLSMLTSLHYLNLSFNHLSGRIPTGPQFGTFLNSSFIGNSRLCGLPLSRKCEGNNTVTKYSGATADDREHDLLYLYLGVVSGLVVGFWSLCGPLLFIRKWRHTYFQYLDCMYDKLWVAVAVTLRQVRNITQDRVQSH